MLSAWRVRRMNVAALSCIIALVLPWAEARGGLAAAAHPMSTSLSPWGGAGDGRGTELGRGHGDLRLRGGGWLEDAMCCFGCRGGNHLEVRFDVLVAVPIDGCSCVDGQPSLMQFRGS